MTSHAPLACTSKYPLYQDVLMTLRLLTPHQSKGEGIPSPDTWVKTRQISDAHNISIYKARLLLLELVKLDLVIMSNGLIDNSLRWYPRNISASDHRS